MTDEELAAHTAALRQPPAQPQPLPPLPALSPQVSGLMKIAGPLIFSLVGPQGSGRRLLVGLGGTLLLALNHKLGLQLDLQEQTLIASLIGAVVLASNAKEAVTTRAQAGAQGLIAQAQATAAAALHAANAQVAIAQLQATQDDDGGMADPPPPDAQPTPPAQTLTLPPKTAAPPTIADVVNAPKVGV